MKCEIFVGFLVVLACHDLSCWSVMTDPGRPLLSGNCTAEYDVERWRTECMGVQCFKDKDGKPHYLLSKCLRGPCHDTPGTLTKGNQSMIYPDCCDRLECAR